MVRCPIEDCSLNPKLTIIVVNWNTRDITLECLASCDASSPTEDTQIIVIDNASQDGSADAISLAFPGLFLIRNGSNRGFAAANNQALRVATGRFLLLLNSDTLVLGDVIEQSVRYMDTHPDVGVMGCRVLNPDRSVQLTCFGEPSLLNLVFKLTGLFKLRRPRILCQEHMPYWNRDCERDVDVVTGCYMMVRSEAMKQVGLLDESFFFCGEETDWCRRFRMAGWRVRFVPVGEIIHYGNASGRHFEHRRDVLLTAGLVRFHRKHGGLMAAAAAWLMLWTFNVSRLAFWSVVAVLTRSARAVHRRDHFAGVMRGFREVWPSARSPCASS